MRITEKRRSCHLSANRLAGKMKLPSSPWGSEPWACSLIGPGVGGQLGQKKASQGPPKAWFGGTVGSGGCNQPQEAPLLTDWQCQGGLKVFVDGCQTFPRERGSLHPSLVPHEDESLLCVSQAKRKFL